MGTCALSLNWACKSIIGMQALPLLQDPLCVPPPPTGRAS